MTLLVYIRIFSVRKLMFELEVEPEVHLKCFPLFHDRYLISSVNLLVEMFYKFCSIQQRGLLAVHRKIWHLNWSDSFLTKQLLLLHLISFFWKMAKFLSVINWWVLGLSKCAGFLGILKGQSLYLHFYDFAHVVCFVNSRKTEERFALCSAAIT